MEYWDVSRKNQQRRYLKVRRWDTYSKIIKCVAKKIYLNKMPSNYHKFHKWEKGTKKLPLRKIKKDIKKCNWIIMNSFFDHDNPYRHFFILQSKRFLKE